MQKGIHIQYVNDNEEDGEFPKPIERFEELAFPNWLWDELAIQRFDDPTPIQVQGWPAALRGHDLVSALKLLQ